MTLMRESPKAHGLLLDHDPGDNRRRSVAQADKSPCKNGRRLRCATGTLRQRCVQHVSTILWNHHCQRPQSQEGAGGSATSSPGRLRRQSNRLLDAVGGTECSDKAERLARATADLRPCESS